MHIKISWWQLQAMTTTGSPKTSPQEQKDEFCRLGLEFLPAAMAFSFRNTDCATLDLRTPKGNSRFTIVAFLQRNGLCDEAAQQPRVNQPDISHDDAESTLI